MKTKHTPRPWNTKISKFSHPIYDSNAKLIATCWKGGEPHMAKASEAEANAKLIAAAPELLEALEKLMDVYKDKGQLLAFGVSIAKRAIQLATEYQPL